jgi:streptogramin lyase
MIPAAGSITVVAKTTRAFGLFLMVMLMALSPGYAQAVSITEYFVPPPSNGFPGPSPAGIANGPDGNLWFACGTANCVGNIAQSGSLSELFLFSEPPGLGVISQGPWIAAGADGNMWFATANNEIGKTTPAGVMTLFQIPTAFSGPAGGTRGPDGNVWFAENLAQKIGRITPAGDIVEFAIPPLSGSSNAPCDLPLCQTFAGPTDIVAGPDGNLWFTETIFQDCGVDSCTISGGIGRITPAGVVLDQFVVPTPYSSPTRIALGPDGNLWFTESHVSNLAPFARSGGSIGRITPAGVVTEFTIPTPDSRLFGISGGPDGNVWFAESGANQIGRISPSGLIAEFAVPTAASEPTDIVTGPDGNLWFTETGVNQVAKLVPTTTPVLVDGYMSGSWYDPAQSGQGFQLEFTDQANTAVAVWYTYAPDGSGQNWIYAQGSYDSTTNSVTLPAVLVTGSAFPPNFNASNLNKTPWGSITFTFTDCSTGTASWNSTLPGYGSGSMPINRLTRIKGTTCP